MPKNMNLGIRGAGLANMITNTLTFILNLIYTSSIPEIKDAVLWPDRRIFHNMWLYLKLGIPATFMLCLDAWGNYIIGIIAGYIGVTV